jgi:hypothetical protein
MPFPPELVPDEPPFALLPPPPSMPPAAASPVFPALFASSDSSVVKAGPLHAPIAITTTAPLPKIVVHVARAPISKSSLIKLPEIQTYSVLVIF